MFTIKDVSFSYTGKKPYIFNNINLEIHDGDYFTIMGDNGAGKTTLIKLLLNLLKPSNGVICSNAKRIGYVPQGSERNDFPITVKELLSAYQKIISYKDANAVDESLRLVNMLEYKNKLVGNLSGGQYQRILIARSLIGNPDVLILDELSTSIDSDSQSQIYSILRELNQKKHVTIVSIEHNLSAAISNSNLIYHISNDYCHLCTPEKYIEEFITGKKDDDND